MPLASHLHSIFNLTRRADPFNSLVIQLRERRHTMQEALKFPLFGAASNARICMLTDVG